MQKFCKKYWKQILVIAILLVGFILRVLLVSKVIVGDILAYVEWGQKIWEWGTKTYYFGQNSWYYSPPNYPPLAALLFGGINWLWQHRYWTAQLHNLIKFPPAVFIIYFYKYGEILLYKLVPILADLGLGIIIYKVIKSLTKNYTRAILGLSLFVLNPVTIFISGAWGQTDSLVGFFGLLAFLLLARGQVILSMFLFFVGMYLKPSWGIFIPFYLWILYLRKPPLKTIIIGAVLVIAVAFAVSLPFSENGPIVFTKTMWFDKYIIPVKSVGKASVSAFNFYTIPFRVDRDFFNSRLLGVLPANTFSLLAFLSLNIFAFSFVKKSKNLVWGTLVGIFIIGLGSFLFMVNMLERYFFPAFAPMIIICFTEIKTFIYGVVLNLILALNILWSFYRRGSDEIDHPFTGNNFLLIRILSLVNVFAFVKFFLTSRRAKI